MRHIILPLSFLFSIWSLQVFANEDISNLFQAIKSRKTETAKKIIENSTLKQLNTSYFDDLAFILAAGFGGEEMDSVLEAFLSKGVNINSKNSHGYTAVHRAVVKNLPERIQWLHDNNANLNITNQVGETPAALARLFERSECLEKIMSLTQDESSSDSPSSSSSQRVQSPRHASMVIDREELQGDLSLSLRPYVIRKNGLLTKLKSIRNFNFRNKRGSSYIQSSSNKSRN